MLNIKKRLDAQNNKVTAFFPINTKDRKNIFDWDCVLGHFIKYCYRKQITTENMSEFTKACKDDFGLKLDIPEFWDEIENMYFQNEELYKISPELLLFKAQKVQGNSSNKRLGDFFLNLLQDFYLKEKSKTKLNFIENEIAATFEKFTISGNTAGTVTHKSKELAYLPFLSEQFAKDLTFLNSKPKYFLNSITDFLRLYSFLYTAQISINLDAWQQGEPTSKPCYFIMDNEKASDERIWVKGYGYRQLERNFEKVFPYLAMSESLQEPGTIKQPLWKISDSLNDNDYLDELNNYTIKFIEDRKLNVEFQPANSSREAIKNLLSLSVQQFGKNESRHEVNVNYRKAIETELCAHFIQNRGRAGRVLVFNQDYVLLLTNLAIGTDREQLRFHELILEFEARGVFFDKQSQKVLVSFYERIGNVERMSDSGDAVYVRKTV
jgi:DNA phosphorothioation-dependent restriction protein DptG